MERARAPAAGGAGERLGRWGWGFLGEDVPLEGVGWVVSESGIAVASSQMGIKEDSVTDTVPRTVGTRELDRLVVRFAGDSGDGMQLTGDRFTSASALFGNDLATLPEFPAEIRAPQGTLAGVSAFQVQVSDHDISTPGDAPSVLVAMNPRRPSARSWSTWRSAAP